MQPKQSRTKRLFKAIFSGSRKKRFAVFIIAFAVIGGGIMAYLSFAYSAPLKGAEGEFTPLSSARILDTQKGTGGPQKKFAANETREVQVLGKGGVPGSGVRAVIVNVSSTDPSADSFVTVWENGKDRPISSSLNFNKDKGQVNHVTVKVGTGGKVQVFNANGNVDISLDVVGYYATEKGQRGTRFTSMSPTRVLDTRIGTGIPKQIIQAGSSVTVPIAGKFGLPSDGIKAVVMNVTAVEPTATGSLIVWPSGEDRPATSSVKFRPGQIIANQITVKVGKDGKVKLHNTQGQVNVVFDVAGYFTNIDPAYKRTQAGRFFAIEPRRVIDTRSTTKLRSTPTQYRVKPADLEVPSFADSVVMNTTVADVPAQSFVTLWPSGNPAPPRPVASNINVASGQIIANQTTVKIHEDHIMGFNAVDGVNVIFDVAGYYLADSATPASFSVASLNFETSTKRYSKLEFDYKATAIPNIDTGSLTPRRQTIAYAVILAPGSDVKVFIGRPSVTIEFNKGRSTKIKSTCYRGADGCKSIMPGGSATLFAGTDNMYTLSAPVTDIIAGGTYRFTQEIIADQSGFPGRWFYTSITVNGNKRVLFAERLNSDKKYMLATPGIDIRADEGAVGSCNNPNYASFKLSNFKAGGAPRKFKDVFLAGGTGFADLACPGYRKVTFGTKTSPSLTLTSGIEKSKRDTKPPKITSLSASKKTVTVKATDNTAVAGFSIGYEGGRYGTSYSFPYAVTGISGKTSATIKHTLPITTTQTVRVAIFDNSFNYSEKAITVKGQ